jgi:hypothetical protein
MIIDKSCIRISQKYILLTSRSREGYLMAEINLIKQSLDTLITYSMDDWGKPHKRHNIPTEIINRLGLCTHR